MSYERFVAELTLLLSLVFLLGVAVGYFFGS